MQACPVNFISVDENVIRINAFVNLLLVALYFYTGMILFIGIIGLDFFLKQGCAKASPLTGFSKVLAAILRLKKNEVDSAPKKFASFLGLMMMLGALVLLLNGYLLAAEVLIALFALCTLAEGAVAFCVGCFVYRLMPERLKELNR